MTAISIEGSDGGLSLSVSDHAGSGESKAPLNGVLDRITLNIKYLKSALVPFAGIEVRLGVSDRCINLFSGDCRVLIMGMRG